MIIKPYPTLIYGILLGSVRKFSSIFFQINFNRKIIEKIYEKRDSFALNIFWINAYFGWKDRFIFRC